MNFELNVKSDTQSWGDLKEYIEFLKENDTDHNWGGLYELYKEVKVEFVAFKVEALAMATFEGVYINTDIDEYNYNMIYFVFLHELAHYKRFVKMGIEYHMNQLSLEDWDMFKDSMVYEEMIADNYALHCYRVLNSKTYTGWYQELHLAHNKDQYGHGVEFIFGQIENDKEKYLELLHSVIK